MYLFKNAFKSITRNKLRNILLGIIILVIAVSSCVALSIRQAAVLSREDAAQNMTITAQITFDRQKAMEEMGGPQDGQETGTDGKPDRSRFDFDVLQGSSLTLDEYLSYTKAQQDGDSYYYSGAFSLDATGDLLPYGTEEEDSSSGQQSASGIQNFSSASGADGPEMPGQAAQGRIGETGGDMPGGMGGHRFQVNQGDFSITGYSSYQAMTDLFRAGGSYSITDGELFDESSAEYDCIISSELALYNGLSTGDTIVLCNPQCEEETYTFTICGIYENENAASQENNRFAINDPANAIYISYPAAEAIVSASEQAGNTTTDQKGEETSAALKNTLAFTYTFSDLSHYEAFSKKVYDLGLDDDYTVSSQDAESFENSMIPLDTLSRTAFWFFVVLLAAGGVILITINILNLRERKYEIGVLTAIGMKKTKVALQFVLELFAVTFTAVIIGGGIGAALSVPVTNTLLENQVESASEEQAKLSENFGMKPDGRGGNGDMGRGENPRMSNGFSGESPAAQYVSSVTAATNGTVILQLAGVGLLLTVISGLAALISIMRYEPLEILSNRT